MTWYLVVAVAWNCPGGWFAPIVPPPLRPLVCAPAAALDRYDPAQRGRAEARVRAAGPSTKFYRCDARRCREIEVRWSTEATFKGE